MTLPDITIFPLVLLGCLAVGFILKQTDILKDKYNQYIPLILAILGVLLSWWVNHSITPETTIYGAINGLASTGLYQAFKAFIEGGKKDGM